MLEEMRERVLWSASSLESWTGCPVKWFVERLLRATDIEPDPEPLARGGLAHAALKDTLERLRERSGSARLTPASVGLAKRLLAEALLELEPSYPLSVAPERLPGARRRLQVDLERYLEYAAEQASPLEPTYLELEFGFGETREDRARRLPRTGEEDGRVRTRCRRSSWARECSCAGASTVSTSARRERRWSTTTRAAALRRRPSGSATAPSSWRSTCAPWRRCSTARAVGGFYQPLAGRDIRARGVLDGDGAVELECVRTDRLEHGAMRELLDQCLAAALRAAGEARSGALEPRPDTCAYNGGCAYPTICRCER